MTDHTKYLDEINRLREKLNGNEYNDPSLTLFIVRDWEYTRDAGLDGVCWMASTNIITKNDALWVLEEIEKHIKGLLMGEGRDE